MEKQLQHISPVIVMEKVVRDEALTLKELSVWTGFGYSLVRSWTDLPIVHGKVFPSDFILWRRRSTGLVSANGSEARQPALPAGKSDESLLTHD